MKYILMELLLETCQQLGSDCGDACPVFRLNNDKIPIDDEGDCICFLDGKKMLNFLIENETAEVLFNRLKDDVDEIIDSFPHHHTNISTLGGAKYASLLILTSLDSKQNWPNGILENSKYHRFHIDAVKNKDNVWKFTIENFTCGLGAEKIRTKSVIGTNKLLEYITTITTKLTAK